VVCGCGWDWNEEQIRYLTGDVRKGLNSGSQRKKKKRGRGVNCAFIHGQGLPRPVLVIVRRSEHDRKILVLMDGC